MASGGDFAAEVTWAQLQPVLAQHFLPATKGLKIVEVGCGLGELSFLMQKAGHRVVAIDPSSDAIEAARRRGVIDARQCGVEELAKDFFALVVDLTFSALSKAREERWSFDVVLFTRSLHHIGDLDGVLRLVRDALLKVGGILVIEEFGREDIDRPTAEWYYALHDSLVAAGAIDDTTRHRHRPDPDPGSSCSNSEEDDEEVKRRRRRRRKEENRDVLDRWARQFRWSHHGMAGIERLHLGREMVAAIEREFGHILLEREPVLFRFVANHVDRKQARRKQKMGSGRDEEEKDEDEEEETKKEEKSKTYHIARNVWRWEERMIRQSKTILPLGILGVAVNQGSRRSEDSLKTGQQLC